MIWPQIEWTINLGTVLSTAAIVGAALWRGFTKMRKNLQVRHQENVNRLLGIEQRMTKMESHLSEHSAEEMARIEHLDKCNDDVKEAIGEFKEQFNGALTFVRESIATLTATASLLKEIVLRAFPRP
jgi:predicted PurR-regulated permease PerM